MISPKSSREDNQDTLSGALCKLKHNVKRAQDMASLFYLETMYLILIDYSKIGSIHFFNVNETNGKLS